MGLRSARLQRDRVLHLRIYDATSGHTFLRSAATVQLLCLKLPVLQTRAGRALVAELQLHAITDLLPYLLLLLTTESTNSDLSSILVAENEVELMTYEARSQSNPAVCNDDC